MRRFVILLLTVTVIVVWALALAPVSSEPAKRPRKLNEQERRDSITLGKRKGRG